MEDEMAAMREALAVSQETVVALRGEVEEERLAAASAASEVMAMMLRLQREKGEVQMELRHFRRFANEKMALDAAEIDYLRALVARRARHLTRVRSRLRDYQQTFLHLGIPLPDGDEGEEQDQEDGLFLEGEDGDYYPQLRCHDGKYYYDNGQDLERRTCLLEHDHEPVLGPSSLEEEEEEGVALPESTGQETVLDRSNLSNDDDELLESSAATVRTFSIIGLFKRVIPLFCPKRNPSQSRNTFGLSTMHVGLLLVLDKCPRNEKTFMRTK